MDPNPYAPPVVPNEQREHDRLFAIARYQRALHLCMFVYLAGLASFRLAPAGLARALVSVAVVLVLIAGAGFVVLLASKTHSILVAIFVGLFTLIPCAGLFAAYYMSTNATALLRRHGYTVTLLGADPSQFTSRGT